ncbi:TAXI family TRAP transporter solute-binding subunit [Aeoliella sp.]|uniref:TAXI family TRAP transporter solute-binding subunit n=1 Tax=Aeoliella sp. TaxID=2795800 RepID=UPI003CCC3D68
MTQPLSRILRKWFAWLMALVLVMSLATWFFMRDTLPPVIRIGTAVEGGLYYEEGLSVQEALDRRTSHPTLVVETSGSQDNCDRLRAGEIDVAIVQGGSVSLDGLAIVTPLHHDVVHVVVRNELLHAGPPEDRVTSIADLAGKQISIGLEGSGMEKSARDILAHYNLLGKSTLREVHFTDLQTDDSLDAAVVTTGVENGDLRKVLSSGEFGLLSVDSAALARRYRHFDAYEVPKNMWPPAPDRAVSSVATSALVVVRDDASDKLVRLLLDSLFEDNLMSHFSTVFAPQEARDLAPARLHPVTRRYHDPFGQYGVMHTVLEGLAAGKELLFALGAAVYLAWDRWRRLKEKENQQQIRRQKERLDAFLEQTLAIERKQMTEDDVDQLKRLLDEVTDIKLRALTNLTHEDLRGDRTFSIFLMQCANLISKIQRKIGSTKSGK